MAHWQGTLSGFSTLLINQTARFWTIPAFVPSPKIVLCIVHYSNLSWIYQAYIIHIRYVNGSFFPTPNSISCKLFFLHKVTQGERSKLSSMIHAYYYFHCNLEVGKLFQSVPIYYHCFILNVIGSIFDHLDSYKWEIWGSCGCFRLMAFAELLLYSHNLSFLMFCEFSNQSCSLLLPHPPSGRGGEGKFSVFSTRFP